MNLDTTTARNPEAADDLLIALGLDPDDQERWEVVYAALATERRLTVERIRGELDRELPYDEVDRGDLLALLDELAPTPTEPER